MKRENQKDRNLYPAEISVRGCGVGEVAAPSSGVTRKRKSRSRDPKSYDRLQDVNSSGAGEFLCRMYSEH
jgi:hypothetical protein